MPKLTVDGIEIEVPAGTTVLQACELAGKEIPRFCYHERLSIAGNCRMCLVEIEKTPKPVASCAMPAADNMVVKTMTPMVKRAREGVMEFLLINHPLDCPICDQGGECDLQDQAMAYGRDRSRFAENKRAVEDKYLGPLIATSMNRCIQCTRCVRFITEVAGSPELGAIGRGEDMEITSYLEHAVTSEMSANVVDLCPVGALTSKPYAFNARPWELTKTESVDVTDAVGSNIRVDARGPEVMRILPRLHEGINEEWISDKTRHVVDGLKRQRLDTPYIREGGKLRPASWTEALTLVAAKLKESGGAGIAAIAGDLACTESMKVLKDLWARLGSPHIDCRQDGAKLGQAGTRAGYLFNTTIAGIEQADALLLIGCNPRTEAPIINTRIRKRAGRGRFPILAIGPEADLTYNVEWLGAGAELLAKIADGRHAAAELLERAQRPMLILGQAALTRPDGAAVLNTAARIAERSGMIKTGWNGFNVLHLAASRVAGLDLGLLPGRGGYDVEGMITAAQSGEIKLVYLLGADERDWGRRGADGLGEGALGEAFVVYQGSHGDAGAHRADVILPGAAYTEKNAIYVNTEGRPQLANRAIFPPGEAREDWAILRALSGALGDPLPYDRLSAVRRAIMSDNEHLGAFDRLPAADETPWARPGKDGVVAAAAFRYAVEDFYLTNPIARASGVMAECSAITQGRARPQAAE
jgi:NADH-quinone oxidoreductase subunit G